ncbi:hypothetical protein BST61_g1638 [Cercospora zeina]
MSQPPGDQVGPLGDDLTVENFNRLNNPDPPANFADQCIILSEKWVFLRNKLKYAVRELKSLTNETATIYLRILKRLSEGRDDVPYISVNQHPCPMNPERHHWEALIQTITPHTTGRAFDKIFPLILDSAVADVGSAARDLLEHVNLAYNHLQDFEIDSFKLPENDIYNSFHPD